MSGKKFKKFINFLFKNCSKELKRNIEEILDTKKDLDYRKILNYLYKLNANEYVILEFQTLYEIFRVGRRD